MRNRRVNSPTSAPNSVYIFTSGTSRTTESIATGTHLLHPQRLRSRPDRKAVGDGRQMRRRWVRSRFIQIALWARQQGRKTLVWKPWWNNKIGTTPPQTAGLWTEPSQATTSKSRRHSPCRFQTKQRRPTSGRHQWHHHRHTILVQQRRKRSPNPSGHALARHSAKVVIQPSWCLIDTRGKLLWVHSHPRWQFAVTWRGISEAQTSRGSPKRNAPAWSFIPNVIVGVAPYEGAATKPKESVVPEIAVGVAQRQGHRPCQWICRFRPTLNLRGPWLAVPYFLSPTWKYRLDTTPEPAVLVSGTEIITRTWQTQRFPTSLLCTTQHARRRRGTWKATKQHTHTHTQIEGRKSKVSAQTTEVQWAVGRKAREGSSEGRTPAINASLKLTLGHNCSYTLVSHPTSTSKVRPKIVVACSGMT